MASMTQEATPGTGAATPPPSPRSRPSRSSGVAVAVVVVLSAIGFLTLSDGSDAAANDLSTIGDFLQPGATATAGLDRLRYEGPAGTTSLENGGVVPLSEELSMAVSLSPFPPSTYDIDVDVYLTTAAGDPVVDAIVSAEWDMILMWHGPFDTTFDNLENGHYRAPFDLFMVGPWELKTQVTAPGFEQPPTLPLTVYVWPE